MVNHCCVPGCKNIWQPKSYITYHKFPIRDTERFAKWMLIDQLQDIKVTPAKRICSEHFTLESFEDHSKVKRLKQNAIPTIFGDTLYMDDHSIEAHDIKEVCLDDIYEKQMEVLDKITKVETQETSILNKKDDLSSISTEKSMHVSIQTSCTYFKDCKKILCLQKKVKTLQQQLKRRNSKIANMLKIIHHLKKTDLNKKDVYKVSKTRYEDLCSNWKEHSYCFRIT